MKQAKKPAPKKNILEHKPEYWESMSLKHRGMFSVKPLFTPIIIIAIVLASYYYLIFINHFFPDWQNYIYWGVKIIIAFEILAMAARTLWGPIIALVVAAILLYFEKTVDIGWLTSAEAWQLLFIALVSFLVTFIVKL